MKQSFHGWLMSEVFFRPDAETITAITRTEPDFQALETYVARFAEPNGPIHTCQGYTLSETHLVVVTLNRTFHEQPHRMATSTLHITKYPLSELVTAERTHEVRYSQAFDVPIFQGISLSMKLRFSASSGLGEIAIPSPSADDDATAYRDFCQQLAHRLG